VGDGADVAVWADQDCCAVFNAIRLPDVKIGVEDIGADVMGSHARMVQPGCGRSESQQRPVWAGVEG